MCVPIAVPSVACNDSSASAIWNALFEHTSVKKMHKLVQDLIAEAPKSTQEFSLDLASGNVKLYAAYENSTVHPTMFHSCGNHRGHTIEELARELVNYGIDDLNIMAGVRSFVAFSGWGQPY